MTELIDEEGDWLNSLLKESYLFVKFFIGENNEFSELVKKAIERITLLDGFERCQIEAIFFKEIEKVASEKKQALSSTHSEQLELFDDLQEHSTKTENYDKHIGQCRIRAWLYNKNLGKDEIQLNPGVIGDPKANDLFLEISHRLLSENLTDTNDSIRKLIFSRHHRICSYLMELLPDSESIEVEKNCLQYPVWQKDKVEISKIMGWFEIVLKTMEIPTLPPSNSHFTELKSVLASKIALIKEDPHQENVEEAVDETSIEKQILFSNHSSKDYVLWTFLLVACVASVIGFWGWLEMNDKVAEFPQSVVKEVPQTKETKMATDFDDLAANAMMHAEQVAHRVLANQTGSVLKDMEKQIKLPDQLLVDVKGVKSNQFDHTVVDLIDSGEKRVKSHWNDKIHRALQNGEAYIFRPNEESLGKIIDLRLVDGQMSFTRADWFNSGATFALSPENYEIRVGTDSDGFLILRGYVLKDSNSKGNNHSTISYFLKAENAWWLDSDQARTEIGLDVLKSY